MRSSLALINGWRFLFPFSSWMPAVGKNDLRADFMAALTGAIVVLPQGVAFATIAGMPPQYGLYAGMVPAIVAALFGSSRHLVSGPTTAASVVLFSALSAFAVPATQDYVSLALTLTFMVGIFELALGLARMGALVNFISHAVVVGFTAGAAVLIAAKQLKYFFGVEIERGGHLHDILLQFSGQLGNIDPWVTLVSFSTLLSGLAFKRWLPRIPYMIGAMAVGSLVAYVLNIWMGDSIRQIETVGALPSSLPPLSSPDLTLQNIKDLAPTALAVTLFALTEAVSIGRSLAAKGGYRIDGNQEFIGQGLSNLAGSFFSGYVATGSFNRSGVNYASGAKTPLSSIFAALLLMVIVLLVAPFAAYMPNAAMAGLLFLVGWGLIDWHHISQIFRTSRSETGILLVTFLSTLFLELELAIFTGVLLSLVLYLHQTSHPQIHRRVPDPSTPNRKFTDTSSDLPECPQMRLIRIDGSLFFGAVSTFSETLRRYQKSNPDCTHLAIVMQGVNFIDIAGAEALAAMPHWYRSRGGGLYLIRPKEQVVETLERGSYMDTIGRENVFHSKTTALRTIYRRLDYDVCRTCNCGVFLECGRMGKQEPQETDP
jgi:sulfate permease, SulP family